jgi:hypothetical protein
MIRSFMPRWTLRTVALLLTLLTFGGTAAAKNCDVHGTFTSVAVSATECASPIGLCTAGTIKGGLDGTFEFVGTTLSQSVDTPTTGVVFYTGDIVFHLKAGDLLAKDAGALGTTGAGDVADVITIVGGTGGLAGATGTLRNQGVFTQAAGGSGEYTGQVCVP